MNGPCRGFVPVVHVQTACVLFVLPEKAHSRHAPDSLYLASPARLEESHPASEEVSNAHRRCQGRTKNHP